MRTTSRPLLILICALVALPLGLVVARAVAQSGEPANSAEVSTYDAGDVPWRGSVSAGKPWEGALFRGVQLPAEGADFFTWDFPLHHSANRPWRRWAADRTLFAILRVIAEYRATLPWAPRVGIADLSRPHGGNFGRRFGGRGHASHQNGVDADILYPRLDRQELAPSKPSQIDRGLAQDLVNRFVAAGAEFIFVGPHTRLTGPRKVVHPLVFHDDHMHVRFFARGQLSG
jgi:murein endopeptidase